MNDIFSITKGQLQDILVEAGIKKFRADQIFHYIYKENIWSWDEMVLLPKKDREILKGLLPIYIPEVADRQVSEDKETVKLLLLRLSFVTSRLCRKLRLLRLGKKRFRA